MEMKKVANRKLILAQYNERTIKVYQAYNDLIADEAIELGTFGSYFKVQRMTWIKPSFLWMMYRSGWATKEGQNRILAIDIERTGFNKILEDAVLSEYKENFYDSYEVWKNKIANSKVRCQWDPDRDIYGNPLNRRAIQLGIRGEMVKSYINEWIVNINDITEYVIDLKKKIKSKEFDESMLPIEKEYPIDSTIMQILGISS